VVDLWTNRTERMAPGVELEGPSGKLVIVRASSLSEAGRWLVSFAGFDSEEAAESIRGAVLRAAPIDVPGALWVHELIGADVYDEEGLLIGSVKSVQANPASDLLILEDGRLIPLSFVSAEDSGRLTVKAPSGLLDL
jgi:16S rRNA processing protein RimM